MTVTGAEPGNLFVAGKPIVLRAHDARGTVRYEGIDYFGKQAAHGSVVASGGEAEIRLPAAAPGWYRLKFTDDGGEVTTSVGVVMDRRGAALPADGRVCADAAASWLIRSRPEQTRPFAHIVRVAGIPWVRERCSWAEMEPSPGKYDWSGYEKMIDAYAAEGVHVYQIWHSSPEWTHPGKANTYCPDDLRTAYRFAEAVSRRFAGSVGAWEMWNEPDIGFWPDLSDRLAAYAKTASLGLQSGNPKATVLGTSLCAGAGPFARGVFESGIGEYIHTFNWHIYDLPSVYPERLKAYRDVMAANGVKVRPAWLTEAGIRVLGSEGERKAELSDDNLRQQCRFIPRSVAMSLAAGDQKHFFFVLPEYLENGVQFGVLDSDLTPHPAFIALSAAANILGRSKHLGEYRTQTPGVVAQAFSAPGGNVLVLWAEKETEVSIPTEKEQARVMDTFGAGSEVKADGGSVRVRVGPDAVYVTGIGDRMKSGIAWKPAPVGSRPVLRSPRVVLAGRADLPIQKAQNRYAISGSAARAFTLDVEVYNFGSSPTSGSVGVVGPKGWAIGSPARTVRLDPMGRSVISFTVRPAGLTLDTFALKVTGRFGDETPSPSVSYFGVDPASMSPERTESVAWLDASKWTPSAAPGADVRITNPEPRVLRIDSTFPPEGDHWAYPEFRFGGPVDLSGWDGFAFDLKASRDDANSYIRMMLVESNGAHYITEAKPSLDSRKVVFLFRDVTRLEFMGADPNNRLDLDDIVAVKLGCNTDAGSLSFDVKDPRLVRFPKE